MDLDPFKKAWRDQTPDTRLSIDPEELVKKIQRDQKAFAAMIFWRDLREIGTGLLMVPLWLYLGFKGSLPWTWYLMVPVLIWITGYMLVDRMRHKRQPSEPGDPLRQRVRTLLAQVEHQIRLLRGVFWWAILPLALAILAFFGQGAWEQRNGGWWTVLAVSFAVGICASVLAVVYWLNQYAVRADLEPRRLELQALLTSLEEETPDPS